jgi:glutamine cyclotransferase|tara:strand:+ start:51362 stop:52450 length:1089 start_codon:yes stop_codon:yes gene_type:complete
MRKNVKGFIVIALIVLAGGAVLFGPLLNKDETPAEARFDFLGDVAAVADLESTIKIKLVGEEGLAKVELLLDSRVIKSWSKPTSNLEFKLAPKNIGTFTFQVVSTDSDGLMKVDERRLKVVSNITPEALTAKIVQTHAHDITSFTQGLEFYEGRLFEGTGQRGQSKISEINLEGEPVGNTIKMDGTYFGEGITMMDGILFQLTWQKGVCFTYSIEDTLKILPGNFNYVGQDGWGLCNDGKSLIMSDGTERITFRSPKTFQAERTIDVYNNRGALTQLNELEYINGKIYANVYQTNLIVVIDPETGKILEQINCDNLVVQGRGNGDVLNGIAYNPETGKTYLTGKLWPKMFEVEFTKNETIAQ